MELGRMVRKIRNVTLESRNARLKLKQDKKPTFVSIGQGLSVGYRRNKTAGTWVFRKADGKGGMQTKAIGIADDFEEADGKDILTWWQAVETVRQRGKPDGGVTTHHSAAERREDACSHYSRTAARCVHFCKGRRKEMETV
jgi:hypothetical protein